MPLSVDLFTDPSCPWAYSAEPVRQRLRWLFGDQLDLRPRMIVLSEDTSAMEARGFTPERLAAGFAQIQAAHGMPIAVAPRPRLAPSVHACRAVVAARLHAPEAEEALLRRLRIATMSGALLDEPAVIARAATEAGLDADALAGWIEDPAVEAAMREDMRAARSPGPAALALDHKLAPADGGRRYTAPSYVFRAEDGGVLEAPGFQPAAVHEALVANLAPGLERRAEPADVEEVLAWAGEPLATAEVAALLGTDRDDARARLAGVAEPTPVGADAFWSLVPAATPA
jgi:predicted DsbA family dithiol-disulfide isomerase